MCTALHCAFLHRPPLDGAWSPTYPNVCVYTASILVLYVTDTYDTNARVPFVCSIPLQRFLFRVGSFVFCILCKDRSQVSAQHFILFAYPLGLLGACINQVFGVRKRKEVAITANGVLLRLAVKSITRWALEDKIRSFVPIEPCTEPSTGLQLSESKKFSNQLPSIRIVTAPYTRRKLKDI